MTTPEPSTFGLIELGGIAIAYRKKPIDILLAVTDRMRTNWAGNYRYRALQLHTPGSLSDLQELVRRCDGLKALGARHSFNGIADSDLDQVSLSAFDEMLLDATARTVRVGAGVTYGQLAPYLDRQGFALHNLASLPHISVVGACSTGTHGSGSRIGNLSTAVAALEMVTASGGIVNPPIEGAAVGLGALGVVTEVTLRVEPRFDVAQTVYEGLSFAVLERHLEDVFSLGYSVSLFTDWQDGRAAQMWVKRRGGTFEPELFGAKAASEKLHPLPGFPAESCTEQLGEPGPWHERLPHFRMDHTPSGGDELQTEYFVPLDAGYEAIRAVEALRDHITPLLFVSELRTIHADSLWMSPCYKRPSLAIHFTWKPGWEAVRKVMPLIEAQLAAFHARPHWAKLFAMTPGRLYERLEDFRELANHYDPAGKFRNRYLNTKLFV
jgi:xylitol oxidase